MQRKSHDSCVFLLCIPFPIVLQPFFQCRPLGRNSIHLIVQVLDHGLGFQVDLIIAFRSAAVFFLFLFSFITVNPILWMFLCGKRELVGARPLHLAAARPFRHLKAPLGLSLLRCARKRELVGARPLHLAAARPFRHLKAPLGLSLLRCARKREVVNTCFLKFFCHIMYS